VLFLDIDGVLNRTGYRPAESEGLRSWIEPELAARSVRVSPLAGLDDAAARAIAALFEQAAGEPARSPGR
jgi:hypothetical protein